MGLVMIFLAGAAVGGGAKWLYDAQQSQPSVVETVDEVESSAETPPDEANTANES